MKTFIFNSKCEFLLENQTYAKGDALFAVKLDPAVLEAQVTVGPAPAPPQDKSKITKSTSNITSQHADSSQTNGFKAMLSMQQAALQSLSSEQFDLLLKYVDTLRKQRVSVQKQMECRFCKKNGQPMSWYSTHSLKDNKGRVRCPVLRAFFCQLCGATGDHAHTIKYCPERDIRS
ncbi:uncharacterized protein [Epargyreus clarus]|uniref:uncharacterized protein n=1 Tax=Epargyreus clarus TaxID=520877 RepID=UPI003C2C283D